MHVDDIFPPSFTVPLTLKSTLRYGENPHQKAAFYGDNSLSVYNAGGIATAVQHHGKVRRSFLQSNRLEKVARDLYSQCSWRFDRRLTC